MQSKFSLKILKKLIMTSYCSKLIYQIKLLQKTQKLSHRIFTNTYAY